MNREHKVLHSASFSVSDSMVASHLYFREPS